MSTGLDIAQITEDTLNAFTELIETAQLQKGQIVVVGCSTSEIQGEHIGSSGSSEAAKAVLTALMSSAKERKIYVAVQCCEHLNRALVIESEAQERYQLDEVSVIPVRKAGGSLAAEAMQQFSQPVVVEKIQAHAGLDIGSTLIGMHLRPVAVPVRLKTKYIGKALLIAARTRPKLIGGVRAVYE